MSSLTGGAAGAPKLGKSTDTNASNAEMSHCSKCWQMRPALFVTYFVVPVYGFIAGLPGTFSVAASLHFRTKVSGPVIFRLIRSACDFAGLNNFETAVVYGCTPFTVVVGSLKTQS